MREEERVKQSSFVGEQAGYLRGKIELEKQDTQHMRALSSNLNSLFIVVKLFFLHYWHCTHHPLCSRAW